MANQTTEDQVGKEPVNRVAAAAAGSNIAEADKKATSDEPWTVLRLLDWTTDFFKRKGVESPRLDAEVLLAAARDCDRIDLYAAFNDEPNEEIKTAFREMVKRRGAGAPVAQLVGHKEFYAHKFRVDESTLIPRPETEYVVITAIDHLKTLDAEKLGRPVRVADVGTGSGAIGLSIAAARPECEVVATDISADALKIARYNASHLSVDDRVTFAECDLLSGVESPEAFDVIVSNPPYVSEAEYEQLDPIVRDHEPKTALVGGPRGTEIIKRLLNECIDRLEPGGMMAIELSPMIAAKAKKFAEGLETVERVSLVKDMARRDRILVVHRP